MARREGISDSLSSDFDREIFLDCWWAMDKTSFNEYHKDFAGSGTKMIDALEEEKTRLFIAIFELADAKVRAGQYD